jgi:hypothetical protein
MSDEALLGLLGVIVGFAAASGFTFWSARRSELERAVVACAVLRDELRALQGASSPTEKFRVEAAWAEQRSALICEMRPEDFDALASEIRRTLDSTSLDARRLDETLDALRRLLWKEHQAVIFTPFVNYVRRNTLSSRVHALIERGLRTKSA